MTESEKAVQRQVIRFYEGVGCIVYRLGGQPRKTMQTPGLPDLWVFCPRKRVGFWFEVKAECGRPSPEQITFAESCATCRVPHAIGGLEAAHALAKRLGIIWTVAA